MRALWNVCPPQSPASLSQAFLFHVLCIRTRSRVKRQRGPPCRKPGGAAAQLTLGHPACLIPFPALLGL